MTVSSVLFVCLGNICRSPTAEAVLRAKAPNLKIDSAGTGDWHVGEPPYGPMQQAAANRGYDLSSLRARQFQSADFGRFDLIFAMDENNLRNIEALRPAGVDTPVRLFADQPVPDPYYTRDFDECLDIVEAAAEAFIRDTSAQLYW